MKTILYMVSTLRKTGPTNQLYYIISNIDRSKFRPIILTLSKEPNLTRIDDFRNNDIDIITLNLSRIGLLLYGRKKMKSIVNAIKPDIIHGIGFRPDFHLAKDLTNYSTISTVRNCIAEDYVPRFGKILGTILTKLHVNLLKKIDRIITCSYSVQEYLEATHNINASTIQNGVDTERFCPVVDYHERSKIKQELSVPNERFIFITTGRINERKDQIQLIKSFNKVFAESGPILIVVGEGELMDECREIAGKNVIFTGRVSNVEEYLKISDVFVSTSKSEGLPNSVLEAMSCGIPLLLSDIKPHKEFFNKQNDIGILYELGNANKLECALYKMYNYSYDELANISINCLNTRIFFAAKTMSISYQETYEKQTTEMSV